MSHPQGKTFKPVPHYGGWITLGLAALFFALATAALFALRGRPVNGGTFWLGATSLTAYGLSLFFVYRSCTLFQMQYYLDRNGLEIQRGSVIQRIPIGNISAIQPANELSTPSRRFFGYSLPDWCTLSWGKLVFRATAPLPESLAVQSKDAVYIISPQNPQQFIEAWQLRLPLGPTQHWQEETICHSVWAHPLLRDKLGLRLIGGAALLTLILVGAVMIAYPGWPAVIPIRFDALGRSAGIAERQQLLWIPVGGAVIFLFNLFLGLFFYKKDRVAAYLLWVVAMALQIGLWVGVRMITG